ncbi:uncharacterized protein MEPE_04394 [Melanopsichium pennsylvanicum]|uniref:Uncharacterized protein n=1 Tax=Melanopsichium pennsylvanicum TaxID=63383 RepID=A0AAJ4XN72_9BASI|nr:uncharacterized protein MEPE_04394 [Melanopsichium pennsylvanicum]
MELSPHHTCRFGARLDSSLNAESSWGLHDLKKATVSFSPSQDSVRLSLLRLRPVAFQLSSVLAMHHLFTYCYRQVSTFGRIQRSMNNELQKIGAPEQILLSGSNSNYCILCTLQKATNTKDAHQNIYGATGPSFRV